MSNKDYAAATEVPGFRGSTSGFPQGLDELN